MSRYTDMRTAEYVQCWGQKHKYSRKISEFKVKYPVTRYKDILGKFRSLKETCPGIKNKEIIEKLRRLKSVLGSETRMLSQSCGG